MEINNEQFLQTIFGEKFSLAHVTSFTHDPSNIPTGESGRSWAGGYYKDKYLTPDSNQFYTVSLFKMDEQGKANRRKVNFEACFVIALDDVKEKLPIDQVNKLPPPSIVLRSSLYSEQWLYLLDKPCNDASMIDNLHDGLIANGLAPDGKDPGQKGITRYLRLPEGVNTKAKRIIENNGIAPKCEVSVWHPERRYSLEQLASPFDVELDAPRADKRVDGATEISDHPILNTKAIRIKAVISGGRFDVTCPWLDEHTGSVDNGSAVFTNTDGTIGFKCHHGNCDSRTGANLLKYIEEQDIGFNERLKHWQLVRELADIKPAQVESTILTTNSPLGLLRSTIANGDSQKMKSQMSTDKFVLDNLAILGQWTVFYAGPNTGKTLLTQWLLKEAVARGDVDGSKVFYANCDDTYRGGIEKLEIAEEFGYQMMLPNVKGFKPDSLVATMSALAESSEANGVVIITDTLKKLVDLMDKKTSTSFGKVAREFVGSGGTLICLAHVNKHKGENGKSIYTGTADIRDDADCVFMLEHLGSSNSFEGGEIHTVEFECIKSRGDVAQSIAFQYTRQKGTGYRALLDSVIGINRDSAENARQAAEVIKRQKVDAEVIEQIKTALTNGINVKGDVVKFVTSTSDVSRRSVNRVLDDYETQLWDIEKGAKNSLIYTLIDAPLPPVSFL